MQQDSEKPNMKQDSEKPNMKQDSKEPKMQQDSEKTFDDIYNGDPSPHLKTLFLTLQQPQFQLERRRVQKWAQNLRFLCMLSNVILEPSYPAPSLPDSTAHSVPAQTPVPTHGPLSPPDPQRADPTKKCSCDALFDYKQFSSMGPGDMLYVSNRDATPSCRDYVAVSYCWQYTQKSPGSNESQGPEEPYLIQTKSGIRHNRAPRDVIDRAMKYADSVGTRFIWIDQECIDQDNRTDKEHGIQSMDLVYFNARRAVGLLDGYIHTQAQMDALSWVMQYNQFYGRPGPEAVDEVLELISEERWLTRAWVYQEIIAAQKRMMLLLRCNPQLNKPPHLGTVPGEIVISLDILEYQTGLMQSQDGKPLRRHLEWIYAIHLYGRSGLHAFQHLARLKNTRVLDKLAILGNLCDYPIRLDTTLLTPNISLSFSACAFTLAMLNGDISFVMGFSSAFADITANTEDKATSEADGSSFSWTPPSSVAFKTIGFTTADPPCRISCQLHHAGLRVKGWFSEINQVVCLPKTKARYSLFPLLPPINEIPQFERVERIEAAFRYSDRRRIGFPDVEIFWDILRELIELGHINLAQILWNAPCVRENKLRQDKQDNLPKDVTEVIDPSSHQYLLDKPPYNIQESDAPDLFYSNHEYQFISYRVVRDGQFWHNSDENAIADVGGPTKLFTPDLQRASKRDKTRISWVVSPTVRIVDDLPVCRGMSLVTGFPAEQVDHEMEEIIIV